MVGMRCILKPWSVQLSDECRPVHRTRQEYRLQLPTYT